MTIRKSNRRCRLSALLMLCLLTGPVSAQPPPPLPEVISPEAVPPDAVDDSEPNVRRLYVPTSELDALLKGDRQGVVLPREEFRKLFEAAQAAEEANGHRPDGAIITFANAIGRVDDDLLRLTIDVQLNQFSNGWQISRLPLTGLSLHSASVDDQPAAVHRDEEDRNVLLVFTHKAGQHTLKLELSAPLKSVGSDWLAEFQPLGVPTGTLTLTLAEGKSLLVDGLKYAAPAEGNAYQIPIGGRNNLSLRMTDRDLRTVSDALVFANTAYGLQVAPGEITWNTQTSVQAFGQSLSQLTFSVPANLQVAAVESTGLAEWTLGETDRGRRVQITLDYRQPFEGERTVNIRGVVVPEEGEWTVPNLILEDADSHAGSIIVRHGPEIRLQADYGDAVRPISGDEERRVLRFGAMNADFDLEFRTLGKQQSVHAAMTNLLTVTDRGLDLDTVVDFATYFVPMFEARITLPADFEVTAAVVGDGPVDWSIGGESAGMIEVRIELEPPLMPGDTRRLRLSAHADLEDWPIERDPVLVPLPAVGLPQAEVVEARYGIISEADYDLRTVDLTGMDPARLADLEGLQAAARAAGHSLRLGFVDQDTEFSGQLEVTRKLTRLAVSTIALSRIESQSVRTDMQAFVTIDGGGTDGLLIELPESAGSDLRFTVEPIVQVQLPGQAGGVRPPVTERVAIVEQTVSEPANGRRTWALRFDRRMRGNHVVRTSVIEPRADADDDTASSVTLPSIVFVGADRQNGWIAVEARNEQRLQVTATDTTGQPLLAVDPIDLPGMGADATSQQRIVAGRRYVRPGYNVTVVEESFDPSGVPTALADTLHAKTVLSETGLLQHQLDVSFRAVGVQSLHLRLPEGADLWAALIDQRPVEVRQAGDAYQLPIVAGDDPAAVRSLRIIYRSQQEKIKNAHGLTQSAPVLAAVSGSGQRRPIEILQQEWTLHYPRDVVLLESRGLFAPANDLTGDSWLRTLGDELTLPTFLEATRRLGIVLAIVLVLWVGQLFWRRFGGWALAATIVLVPVGCIVLFLFYSFAAQDVTTSGYFVSSRESDAASTEVLGGTADGLAADEAMGVEDADGEGFGLGGMAPDAPAAVPNTAPMPADESTPPEKSGVTDFARPSTPQQMFRQTDTPFNGMVPAAAEPQRRDDNRQAGSGATTPRAKGALLSLSLDIEAPDGMRSEQFVTFAQGAGEAAPQLNVSYGSRSFREVIELILGALVVVVMWWMRHESLTSRLAVLLFVLVLPIAAAPIAPPGITMLLEGLLLGGIVGTGLWVMLVICRLLAPVINHWAPSNGTAQRAATTSAMLIALGGSSLFAQDAPPVRKSMPPAPVPTVVVPYEDDPLAAKRVFLPQELFRKLWHQAHPDWQADAVPPVEGLVAEALYAIDATAAQPVDEEFSSVRVQTRFVLHAFRDSPVWVTLPLNQVAVESAVLDETTAALEATKDGRLRILLESSGLHVLDIAFDVPANLTANSGELTLPLHPVTSGSLTLTLPDSADRRSIRATVGGRAVVFSRTTNDQNNQVITLPVDGGGPLLLVWQPSSERGGDDNIVHVESRTAVEIDDVGLSMRAEFAFGVKQGLLTEVPFRFPDSVRLKRVLGADVGGWQIAGEGDERTLTIFLRRDVSDATTITAELYVPQEDRSDEFDVSVPPFGPRDLARETGEVALLAGNHLDVRASVADGLRQIDRGNVQLPQLVDAAAMSDTAPPVQLAYRFSSRPWALDLSVAPKPPGARITAEHGIYVGQRKVLYGSRFDVELSGAPRQTMTIALTDDFQLTNVIGETVEDWFVEDAELVLDFGQPRVGKFEIIVEGNIPRDPTDNGIVIITPLPLDLDRQQSALAVWVDPMYSATLDSFDTWRTVDQAQLPASVRGLQQGPPQFGFQSQAIEPEIVGLQLLRRQPRLITDAVTLIAVSDVSVDYGLTLRWTIESAATDTLIFTTADWLEDRLEISGASIRQITQTTTDDGRVRWTVQLTDSVQGQLLLSAVATLPLPVDGQVAAPGVQFELPAVGEPAVHSLIDAQQSFAVLVNLSRGRVSPVDDLGELNVRREQLPLVLPADLLAQAMAIVRVPQNRPVAWTWQRLAEQQPQAAQITSAELTSVLAVDGSLRTRANYRVRNRGQQFLALALPESARILSVLVKDRPSRPLETNIGDLPVVLVPLPQTSAADLSFLVEVVLQDHLDVGRLDDSLLGEQVDLPSPEVITPRQSPEYGVPVVHTSWTVYVPDRLSASVIDSNASDGRPRTNVSQVSAAAADALSELSLYGELSDLTRMLELSSRSSSMQRTRVLNNVKQLREQLSDNYAGSGGENDLYEQLTPADQELAARKQELLDEAYQNAQQAEQELNSPQTHYFDDSAVTSNSAGRQFVVGNNFSIIESNRGEGVALDKKQSRFSFESAVPGSGEEKGAGKAPAQGKAVDSRARLRGQLSSQMPLSKADELKTNDADRLQIERRFGNEAEPAAGFVPLEPFGQTDPFNEISDLLGDAEPVVPSGGLSLPIELPLHGEPLTFTKGGGDPRLALTIRPQRTSRAALGWLWAIVIAAAGAWGLHQLAHARTLQQSHIGLSLTAIALGLVGLLTLPFPFTLAAGLLLIIGSLSALLAWQPTTETSREV